MWNPFKKSEEKRIAERTAQYEHHKKQMTDFYEYVDSVLKKCLEFNNNYLNGKDAFLVHLIDERKTFQQQLNKLDICRIQLPLYFKDEEHGCIYRIEYVDFEEEYTTINSFMTHCRHIAPSIIKFIKVQNYI